ncbi:MAG: CCA tRNA nucleotidyltransferase [Acidobacteriales bacterium]|nr:CCA tRNA nucleotidyltransferase [Terriglobales bacterium]
MADYIYMMESRLTPEQKRDVALVQEVAREHGMNVFLVGGVVRDILAGQKIRDLDFAIQGNALKLQKDLEKHGMVVQGTDEHLRTLYLLMPGNLRGELASTRSEVYDKPGKPPEIGPATIQEDLRRRDFTVNAMALSLNEGSHGLLLDPFNGAADIEGKHIRILHNYSFLEEPSRLIRATRFMARLEWTMEERTKARYDAAVEGEYIEHVNRKVLGHEMEQIAHESDPLKVMRALEKEDWLKALHGHWSVAKADVPGLNNLIKVRQQMQDLGYVVDWGPAAMYFLSYKMNSADVNAMMSAIPRKAFVQEWKHLEDEAKESSKRLTGKEASTNSLAWKLLSNARPETILNTAAISKNRSAVKKIQDFLGKWRLIRKRFPVPEMAEMRITPELPEYPKIVDAMFLLMLDGKLRSASEIKKFLAPYAPPEPEPIPVAAKRGRSKKKEAEATPPPPPEPVKKPEKVNVVKKAAPAKKAAKPAAKKKAAAKKKK